MKRKLTFIFLVIFGLLLVSCKNKEDTYEAFKNKHLVAKTAFQAPKKEYYLYFYKNNCPFCDDIKELIFKQAKDEEMPLYFINYNDVEGILKRTKDIEFSNYGLTSFEEIEIYGFPTVLLLRNGRVIDQFIGANKITNELRP